MAQTPIVINNTASAEDMIKLDQYFNGKFNTTANGTGDGYIGCILLQWTMF